MGVLRSAVQARDANRDTIPLSRDTFDPPCEDQLHEHSAAASEEIHVVMLNVGRGKVQCSYALHIHPLHPGRELQTCRPVVVINAIQPHRGLAARNTTAVSDIYPQIPLLLSVPLTGSTFSVVQQLNPGLE
jgi:hypothetical protein